MKRIVFVFLWILILQLPPIISKAQNHIKVSTTKVLVDGKYYYFHKVKRGQTLYSIAKAYEVSVNEIAFENPGIFEGLKVGSEIKIPVTEINEEKYIKHLVAKGETIYSICKQFKITQEKLELLNPEIVKEGLLAGKYIKIPKKEMALNYYQFNNTEQNNTTDRDTAKFIYHKVAEKETLYYLSKQYNVPIDRILQYNPEVKQEGLKKGNTIKIPKPFKANITLDHPLPSVDSLSSKYDSLALMMDTIFSIYQTNDFIKQDVKILLNIPFSKNDFHIPNDYDFDDVFNYEVFPYLEFYEGLLLAIDTLRTKGINIHLNVVDSDDSLVVKTYFDQGFKPDLFIGKTKSKVFNFVYQWRNEDLNFIEPFFTKSQINSNRYFNVLPTRETEFTSLKSFLLSLDTANLIIPYSQYKPDKELEDSIYNEIYNSEIIKEKNYQIKNVDYTSGNPKSIENLLSVGRKNYILFLSSNEPEVNKFLSKVRLLTKDYDISVIGLPIWRKFNLDDSHLHRLKTYLVTPNYIDYNSDTIRNFISKFQTYYKTLPSKYAFWGYDVAWYFINAVCYFGNDFAHCLSTYNPFLLETKFTFQQTDNGSYQNVNTQVIYYDEKFNLNVVKEKSP